MLILLENMVLYNFRGCCVLSFTFYIFSAIDESCVLYSSSINTWHLFSVVLYQQRIHCYIFIYHRVPTEMIVCWSTCSINVRENQRHNQEWIIQRLTTLGTQDTGRRQKQNKTKQNKTRHVPHQIKNRG